MIVLIMGVAGAGKSTVAARLATDLGWRYVEADAFHDPSCIARMAAGGALTDADRWPWLERVIAACRREERAGGNVVLACSALKAAYRHVLGEGDGLHVVYLRAQPGLVRDRVATRRGHFAPVALVDSQFTDLEEPGSACPESMCVVPADWPVERIVSRVRTRFGI
ncbi:MAG: gluconokinase [Gammaproteobacteria bacterium]